MSAGVGEVSAGGGVEMSAGVGEVSAGGGNEAVDIFALTALSMM